MPPAAPNPALPAACGLNVMLVVDSSGSIASAGAEPAVRSALNAFIGALNDTGSDLGLIDFDTTATSLSPLIPLSTASGSFAFFTNYANNFRGDGRTNWDDALFKARSSGADLTLFITDGMPNEYVNGLPHTGHTGNPSSGNRPLSFAVDHANAIKAVDGSRMFVVGVGEAAGHTTEIQAVSGTNGPGTNVAVNDFSLTSNFNDLAASLRALVFSLCQSSMTVTKLVDGQPANDWDVTATITSVTGAPGFDWRNPSEPATPPASRTRPTAGAGTATFEWVVGSEANPVPGSVELTVNETGKTGFRFAGGICNIESATRTDLDVVITTLPFELGTVPFDAIVRCTLNNQTIPVVTPVAPTVTQAQCVNGAVTPPTLTLPTTPGIAYSPSSQPPYNPGQSVTVTATITATGSSWPATMPPGWDTGVGHHRHLRRAVRQRDVHAGDAGEPDGDPGAVRQRGGDAADDHGRTTPGVTYTVAPPGPYDGTVTTTVTVTATLADGFAWARPAADRAGRRSTRRTTTATFTGRALTCGLVYAGDAGERRR